MPALLYQPFMEARISINFGADVVAFARISHQACVLSPGPQCLDSFWTSLRGKTVSSSP